ncbi:MAG TPA: ester cyclase [Rubrobacteraceae bacterium]|jgi:predicted ester cyclase
MGGDGHVYEFHGLESFRERLRWYLLAFTDREWAVHGVTSEADKVEACYSGWATCRGGLLGIPSSSQRVLRTRILILPVRDGLVQELWAEVNDLQVALQLGAFLAPEREAR